MRGVGYDSIVDLYDYRLPKLPFSFSRELNFVICSSCCDKLMPETQMFDFILLLYPYVTNHISYNVQPTSHTHHTTPPKPPSHPSQQATKPVSEIQINRLRLSIVYPLYLLARGRI